MLNMVTSPSPPGFDVRLVVCLRIIVLVPPEVAPGVLWLGVDGFPEI